MGANDEFTIFAKTVFAEARGEIYEDWPDPYKGQKGVAWVIKNRAYLNQAYWGGNTIKGVCWKKDQFECWWLNHEDWNDIIIRPHEQGDYDRICEWLRPLYRAHISHYTHRYPSPQDPTRGCDHYNNPPLDRQRNGGSDPDWVQRCRPLNEDFRNHRFYFSDVALSRIGR